MKIEIWSDYACPFCYIGKRQLETALSQFKQRDNVEVVYRTFELYPHAGATVSNTTQGRIEQKYSKTPQGALAMIRQIEDHAERVGIAMRYEGVQNTNTFDAHRLTKFAESKGLASTMNERLMEAYFIDNSPLATRENLLNCAEDIGLDRAETAQMLDSEAFTDIARSEQQKAAQIGVDSVPFFLIDGEVALSGAQPAQMFLNALNDVWAHYQQNNQMIGISCGIDGCQ